MEQQFEEDLAFRLIVPGKFMFVDSDLKLNHGHYYKGALFNTKSMSASLISLTDTPNFLLKKDEKYLSSNSEWVDKSGAQEFAIVYDCDDKYIGDVLPPNDTCGVRSSDGVKIDERTKFLITLSGCWESGFSEYAFGSMPFREGLVLQFKQNEDGLYPTIVSEADSTNKYISVLVGGDGVFCFDANIDESTVFLKEIRPGVFSMNNKQTGRIYFEWVKASVCLVDSKPNSISDILILRQ